MFDRVEVIAGRGAGAREGAEAPEYQCAGQQEVEDGDPHAADHQGEAEEGHAGWGWDYQSAVLSVKVQGTTRGNSWENMLDFYWFVKLLHLPFLTTICKSKYTE